MADSEFQSLKVLDYGTLDELRRFWFEHVEDENRIVLPDMSVMKRFFMGGEDFDTACSKKFTPALDEVRTLNLTSQDILKALPPRSPLDWLSLLLLFDQIPRNCFRGASSGPVFKIYDPIALGIAKQAADKKIFTTSPVLRWNFGYRFWIALPFVHSESMEIHSRLHPEIITPLETDIEGLISGSSDLDDGSPEYKRAVPILQSQPDVARFLVKSQKDSEEMHVDILRKFGRYPHRNEGLGRETKPEEKAFLEGGGATFAPPKTEEERKKWEKVMNHEKDE